MKLCKDKCVFLASSVEYLRYWIDSQVLQPIAEQVESLLTVQQLQNVSELKSHLCLLT